MHGLSTLALIGFAALHLYFTARPEKQFYLRSMVTGWGQPLRVGPPITTPARWTPDAVGERRRHGRSTVRPRRRCALTDLRQHIETIEAGYEFLLAYAAQGRIDEDRSQPGPYASDTLKAMQAALDGIKSALDPQPPTPSTLSCTTTSTRPEPSSASC